MMMDGPSISHQASAIIVEACISSLADHGREGLMTRVSRHPRPLALEISSFTQLTQFGLSAQIRQHWPKSLNNVTQSPFSRGHYGVGGQKFYIGWAGVKQKYHLRLGNSP